MFLLPAISASSSVICPEYITTISSHPYEIRWGNMRIDFSHPLSLQEFYISFETQIKYCSSNAHSKLRDFVLLQDSILTERQSLSRRKIRKHKKRWEMELSYAFYDIWISYEEDTSISLKWGPSRVRGGLISTAQGSDHVTAYLYALFSKSWIKYDLME